MLTQERRNKIHDYFNDHIQGGVCEGSTYIIYDLLVEEGVISEQELQKNEREVCGIFDDNWFTCEGCDWTVPVSMESYSEPGVCLDCCGPEDEGF